MKFLSSFPIFSFRTRASILLLVVLALVATACEYATTATQLTVVTAEEDGFFSDGDEPYVMIVQWRSTPGVSGSTEVSLLAGVGLPLSNGAFDGEVLPIPPAQGEVTFADVVPVGLPQLQAGTVPEVMGAVVVAMEEDSNTDSAIDNVFLDFAAAIEDEIVAQIEPMTFANVANQAAVSAAIVNTTANVLTAVEPELGVAYNLWLSSFGDPDDIVGIGHTVYVASAGTFSDVMNAALLTGLPANAVGGAWTTTLDPIPGQLSFSNGESTFLVDIVAVPTL